MTRKAVFRTSSLAAGSILIGALAVWSCGARSTAQDGPLAPPSSQGAPRLGSWRILGPGGGGAQFNPLPSPHDRSTILVSTDMTGCFLSSDGGASWRMFTLRWPCHFAYDPKNPDVFYAAANQNGLYRTEDRGRSWQLIFPEPKTVQHLYSQEDEAEQFLYGRMDGRTGPLPGVTAVATHPEDSNTVYAAAGVNLYRSANAGKSWKFEEKAVPGIRNIWVDPRPGVRNRIVFLQGVNRAGYFDGSFHEVTPPNKITRIYGSAMSFPPGSDTPVFHLAVAGTFQDQRRIGLLLSSNDLGKTWTEAWRPLHALGLPDGPMPLIRAVAVAPSNPNIVYLSFGALQRKAGEPASFGVARSDDGGRTYRLVWEETGQPAANIDDPWLSEVYGPDWGENPLHMAIHAKDPDYVVTTDMGRTLKTMDGGRTWQGLYARRVSKESWTSTGIDVLNCYGVHFDPFSKGRLLASCTDLGLFRSEDRGATWSHSWKGVPREWRNTMYWVEYDPDTPGLVWGAASRFHDLPRARVFRSLNRDNFRGGMVVSRDSGKTWSAISENLPNVPFTHFIVDWKSPRDRRTIWATAMFRGVYRSDDGGRTWARKTAGIKSGEPNAWRLHLDSRGHLYLVIARRTMRSEPDSDSIGAIYRSEDRGESWQPVALPEGVDGPTDLLADPQDASRLYLTAWPRFDAGAAPVKIAGGGLYLSTDRGATWKPLLPEPRHAYSISADPRHPGRLYTTGFSSSVFRSDDHGATWRRLRGFTFKLGHRVFPDPLDPSKIYVTTMGGSLWHGPADGSPDSEPEDITGPEPVRYSSAKATNSSP